MTQPAGEAAVAQVVPTAEMQTTAPVTGVAATPTPSHVDIKTLTTQVREMAGVENMNDLRKLLQFNWLTLEGEKVWAWGKPAPLNKLYTVIAMFMMEREVRVYAAPTEKGPYLCWRLNKDAPSYGVEGMTLEVFKQELADELTSLAEDMEIRDIGRAEGLADAADYIKTLVAAGGLDKTGNQMSLQQIADAIENDAIDGEGADEEEGE
jgi:hypothetical protein